MGVAIVLVCLMILFRERWFLENTSRGQYLLRRFGPEGAPWALRGFLLLIAILGGLLASGLIPRIAWS